MSGNTFDRFRQTRAARIVAVYSATAWGIFEIIDKTVRTFGWPEAIPRSALILLVVGLVIVTFAAWAYAGQEVGERTGWKWPARIQAVLANRWFGRVAVAGLGVAVLLWGWRMLRPEVGYTPFDISELRAAGDSLRVAVLPVASREARLDLPGHTLSRQLSVDLNDVKDLRTIRNDLVSRRWDEDLVEPKTVVKFGREMDVQFVVVTELERGGEGLRASSEILEARRGESMGHVVVEGSASDLPGLSDRLAMEVYRALVSDDGDESVTSPRRARTSSMLAFKSYLRAERALRRADFSTALAEYDHATQADSTFAMALFRAGVARRWESPSVGPPLERFDAAMAHSDRLLPDDRELLRASGALEWGMLEGVSMLAGVLERRPGDPQAWFLLAQAEVYAGESLLIEPDSVESTIARAAAIDPGFAPTRLMRIPVALIRGAPRPEVEALVDSLAASEVLPRMLAQERTLVELAFGEGGRPSELGNVPVHRLWRFVFALSGPGLLERQALVLEEIRRRGLDVDRLAAKRALYYNFISRGLHSEALAVLDDPAMRGFWPEAAYRTSQRGIGLPADLVAEATNIYDPYAWGGTWFYGGALAVDQMRWSDVGYAVDRLFEESDRIGQEGDGYGSREHSMVGGVLDLYARARDNLTVERVRDLESQRMLGVGSSEWAWMIDCTARWWLGELWLELGDGEQAARYFRSLWGDPMAAERLRQIAAGAEPREDLARR
ncbi:MAG TPA: hypothetical protein VIE68_12790 [Gemmatimonadota bacterium]